MFKWILCCVVLLNYNCFGQSLPLFPSARGPVGPSSKFQPSKRVAKSRRPLPPKPAARLALSKTVPSRISSKSAPPQVGVNPPVKPAMAPPSAKVPVKAGPPVDVVMMIEDTVGSSTDVSWKDRKKIFNEAGVLLQKLNGALEQSQSIFDQRVKKHRDIDHKLDGFYRVIGETIGRSERVIKDLTLHAELKLREYAQNGSAEARGALPGNIKSQASKPNVMPEGKKGLNKKNDIAFVDEEFGKTPATILSSVFQRQVVSRLQQLLQHVRDFEAKVNILSDGQKDIDCFEDTMREKLLKMRERTSNLSGFLGKGGRHRNDIPHARDAAQAQVHFDKIKSFWKSAQGEFDGLSGSSTKEFDLLATQIEESVQKAQGVASELGSRAEKLRKDVDEIGKIEEALAKKEGKTLASSLSRVMEKRPDGTPRLGTRGRVGTFMDILADIVVMAFRGAKDAFGTFAMMVKSGATIQKTKLQEAEKTKGLTGALQNLWLAIRKVAGVLYVYVERAYVEYKAEQKDDDKDIVAKIMKISADGPKISLKPQSGTGGPAMQKMPVKNPAVKMPVITRKQRKSPVSAVRRPVALQRKVPALPKAPRLPRMR